MDGCARAHVYLGWAAGIYCSVHGRCSASGCDGDGAHRSGAAYVSFVRGGCGAGDARDVKEDLQGVAALGVTEGAPPDWLQIHV